MFTYKIHAEDGGDLGEATYAQQVRPGETVWLSGARPVEVVSVVYTPDAELYAGLLMVKESASSARGAKLASQDLE